VYVIFAKKIVLSCLNAFIFTRNKQIIKQLYSGIFKGMYTGHPWLRVGLANIIGYHGQQRHIYTSSQMCCSLKLWCMCRSNVSFFKNKLYL